PKVRRQSDTWGPWGQWSPCSRTCGGGISFRERPCYSQRRDGGSSCVGPARSHRTCSTESCPDGARDFRAQQCAEFDGTEFQGRRYQWLPYYGAPNKCELNCIPKGENFYYKHRDAVADGTPCEPGKRDVCVDGRCRAVGCDHKLDSSKQEDKCLQCGGDGTSCYPVTGTFNANDLSRGYNQIFIVPMGATSIRIEEAAASRNFLAVKNIRGEYYLNGHWTIEAAQALPVASTILQYERGAEGDLAPERLQARGPTSEPLVIELLSQEPNPGVHFEYHLPLGSPHPGVFSWSHGSWSDCSAPCGGGHQSRLVFCTIDNEAYPDHLCQRQPRPADRHPCNPQPCPQTKRWTAGPWAPCSASCGGGSQSRSVYCVLSDGAGGQEAAEEAACAGLPGKPATTQACNLQRCAAWSVEPWGECSKSCSSGTRRRQVVCAIGPPSHCRNLQQPKPMEVELCNRQPCHLPQDPRAVLFKGSSLSHVPEAHRPQAQQNEPSECRGSQFGCCYDNVASATGPLGEGCVGQPSYAYPVQCLLPSAHGSCADWAARWYFIASVGQCNRFWYGGCHGNANNFASEQECISNCRGPQRGPHHPEPGVSGLSTHTGGHSSSSGDPQDPGRHTTGATAPRPPLSSGGLWRGEQELGRGEATFGEQAGGQELGPRTPGLGGNARQQVPPSHSSSYRISLTGSQPFLVKAALGQMVQLFCPSDTSLEPQAGWQKDGHLLSSDRHQLQSDGSLVISSLQAEDAGIYSCGSNTLGHDSQKIQLHITGDDMVVLSETELRHFPQTRNPVLGHSSQDFSLRGDSGGLAAVSSSHPRPATRLRLDRTQPGVVDTSPGQRIRLPCRAEGFPPPTIEWQRDGQPLSSPRHQLQPDGSLVISGVAMEDGGFYTCVAFNGQDRDQHWVQLRVLGELTITGLPPTVTVPEGDTARLLCVVAGESVNIRWSRNGLPVQADGHRIHQSSDGTLLIHNLRARDEGSYTCSAYRGSQAVSRSTEVKVAPAALTAQPRDPSRECIDQPELANCELILQAQLCGNEYYSSFCCASCSRSQPHTQPIWQQG
ncbi:Papilin, partial [Sciurus carolinensis]|nr:Papilin [Sciurus carolinensis]